MQTVHLGKSKSTHAAIRQVVTVHRWCTPHVSSRSVARWAAPPPPCLQGRRRERTCRFAHEREAAPVVEQGHPVRRALVPLRGRADLRMEGPSES